MASSSVFMNAAGAGLLGYTLGFGLERAARRFQNILGEDMTVFIGDMVAGNAWISAFAIAYLVEFNIWAVPDTVLSLSFDRIATGASLFLSICVICDLCRRLLNRYIPGLPQYIAPPRDRGEGHSL